MSFQGTVSLAWADPETLQFPLRIDGKTDQKPPDMCPYSHRLLCGTAQIRLVRWRHITQGMVFQRIQPQPVTRIPKTMQNPWQNNDSTDAGCISRTLIKPVENERFRWAASPATVQFSSAPGAAAFATGRRLLPSGETHISTAAPLWRPPRG